ncbi:MAG: class I adenylate-forming enzyme family protein [Desulfomonilaceae bacterium]
MNVANNLESSAFCFPDRPAVSESGVEITYSQLNDNANRVATGLLRIGVGSGYRIGICAPNSIDWITFYFGVLKAGAVAITLSSVLRKDELTLLLEHSKPRFVFTTDDKLDHLQGLRGSAGIEKVISTGGDLSLPQLMGLGNGSFKAVDLDRTNAAALLYTGGTTGVPKGVMLTHENINHSSHNIVFNERSSENDRALCFLPFNHVFGQIHIMNSTIMSCGCVEILPCYDMDQVLSLMTAGRVTKFFAVPTIYTRLLAVDGLEEKMGKVRYCFSAAASMAGEIVRQWKELSGRTIHESYGMTESAAQVTYNHYYRHVLGSVGTAVPGVEVQIRDFDGNQVEQGHEGEICICGPNIMGGYLDNPEETRKVFWPNGWFRSGDIGLFDENHYLYVVDRLKDVIITGGENVYPREVEEVTYQFPAVQECAVIGLPDTEWGERVMGFIVPRPGKQLVLEDLKIFLKKTLSSFKVPKEYVILDEMPKNSAGKILKRELKKQWS